MPTETTQKPYFFREKNGAITYCDTQEEMFELLHSPKGNNFRDMGKTDYLNLLQDEEVKGDKMNLLEQVYQLRNQIASTKGKKVIDFCEYAKTEDCKKELERWKIEQLQSRVEYLKELLAAIQL